jgi:hypothetical protein
MDDFDLLLSMDCSIVIEITNRGNVIGLGFYKVALSQHLAVQDWFFLLSSWD